MRETTLSGIIVKDLTELEWELRRYWLLMSYWSACDNERERKKVIEDMEKGKYISLDVAFHSLLIPWHDRMYDLVDEDFLWYLHCRRFGNLGETVIEGLQNLKKIVKEQSKREGESVKWGMQELRKLGFIE